MSELFKIMIMCSATIFVACFIYNLWVDRRKKEMTAKQLIHNLTSGNSYDEYIKKLEKNIEIQREIDREKEEERKMEEGEQQPRKRERKFKGESNQTLRERNEPIK